MFILSVESASTCLYLCLSVYICVCQCLRLSACVSVSVECEFPTDAEVGGATGGEAAFLVGGGSNGSVKKTFSKRINFIKFRWGRS